MTNRLAASIFILLSMIAPLQAADDIVGPLRAQWSATRNLVVNLADIIPEDKYGYRPTPEIRSFREQLTHLVWENFNYMAVVAGDPPPDRAKIEAMQSRDEIMKALRESYAYSIRAVADSLAVRTLDSSRREFTPTAGRSSTNSIEPRNSAVSSGVRNSSRAFPGASIARDAIGSIRT